MDKPFAITLDVGTSRANKTGAWRTERPVYTDRLSPCNGACPARENVQSWLYDAEEGELGYERAWRTIMRTNPFPAVMGRVCYHPCEDACNRGQLDEAVGINSVERFLGDEAIQRGWRVAVEAEPTGKRILVVGAGPSGLSAAYHLTLLGHSVTIHEAGPMPGGMMRYGIPRYRLPREVLDAEVARILDLGVTLNLDTKVTDLTATMTEGGYDAAFLAVGAQLSGRAYVPAGAAARVLEAVSLLHELEQGRRPLLGRRVAVYGGGNTAVDVARTAKRLGATDALVIYRRNRDRMPAHEDEVREAAEEGVLFKWLSTVAHVDAAGVTVERMELDDSGYPRPTGEFEQLPADSLVLAVGQDSDLSAVEGVAGIEIENGAVRVDRSMMTGHPGVFAGGDVVPDQRSVTVGIGHGLKAAGAIHAWLGAGSPATEEPAAPADFGTLNTWYYTDAERVHRALLETVRRRSTFDEVVQGLDRSNALFEARRCLSCGHCFSCDNCFSVCPDNAVVKLDQPGAPYLIDLDYCKGCGLCVSECPSGAIQMVPEDI
ncbi:MAG TPA: NAD(P)-binding protein [Pseudonocardia sp.]|jgi:NADPH-dependent glutamate synthase beta subunit-like oxidoreductase|nr:NAD(P)-binding protein [Pseudonocardia sp.]